MKLNLWRILDAIDNDKASYREQCFSGFCWLIIIAAFAACCLIFASIFQ